MEQVDTSPGVVASIRSAKRMAASAHIDWDNYSQPTTKRAWDYDGTGGKNGGVTGNRWSSSGPG